MLPSPPPAYLVNTSLPYWHCRQIFQVYRFNISQAAGRLYLYSCTYIISLSATTLLPSGYFMVSAQIYVYVDRDYNHKSQLFEHWSDFKPSIKPFFPQLWMQFYCVVPVSWTCVRYPEYMSWLTRQGQPEHVDT